MITDNKYWIKKFKQNLSKNFNKTSHFNIIPTILDLMGFNYKSIGNGTAASLLDVIDSNRVYTTGVVSDYRLTLGTQMKMEWRSVDEMELKKYINSN